MYSPRVRGRPDGTGFSLVELMTTLAVAGTLLAAAAPSLVALVHDHRLAAEVNLLRADVHLARIEAIKRNRDVVLCRSTDGRHCARSGIRADWSTGRIIYVNVDGDGKRDPGEPLLQVRNALSGGMRLRFNQWWRVVYHADGSARNGTFTLCDRRGAPHARALIVYYTGRPRIARRQADGDLLDCG